MSASLVTQNFNLPIYAANDITSWLTDFNGAMQLIDAAMKVIKTTADTAEIDLTTLEAQVNQLKTTVQSLNTDMPTVKSDIVAINAQLLTIAGEVSRLAGLVDTGIGETVRGVIGVGETTLTLQFTDVKSTSLVDVYTSEFGLAPTNVVTDTTNNTVTLTFAVRQSNLSVAVIVR